RGGGPARAVLAGRPEPGLDADQPVLAVHRLGARGRRDRRRRAAGAATARGGPASSRGAGVASFPVNCANHRTRVGLTLVSLLAAVAVLAGCGSAPSTGGTGPMAAASASADAAAEANPNLDLGTSLDNAPAPDFTLANQFGQPMSLSQFRGKVVLLAFEDSECTTVCPLTTQSMVLAKQLLGRAGNDVQLLGVDANPQATSVADVMSYSRTHG